MSPYGSVSRICTRPIPLYCRNRLGMKNVDIDDLCFIAHKHQSCRDQEKRVGDMEYTDDITMLENNTANAQKQLEALVLVAIEVGLLINTDKTKVLSKNMDNPSITLNVFLLKTVDNFQYLGAFVSDTISSHYL